MGVGLWGSIFISFVLNSQLYNNCGQLKPALALIKMDRIKTFFIDLIFAQYNFYLINPLLKMW